MNFVDFYIQFPHLALQSHKTMVSGRPTVFDAWIFLKREYPKECEMYAKGLLTPWIAQVYKRPHKFSSVAWEHQIATNDVVQFRLKKGEARFERKLPLPSVAHIPYPDYVKRGRELFLEEARKEREREKVREREREAEKEKKPTFWKRPGFWLGRRDE